MKISVRLGGDLVEHLPPGTEGTTATLDLDDDVTPRDVLARLGLDPDRLYLVALNGEVVRRGEIGEKALAAGDRLEIMPPLKGG